MTTIVPFDFNEVANTVSHVALYATIGVLYSVPVSSIHVLVGFLFLVSLNLGLVNYKKDRIIAELKDELLLVQQQEFPSSSTTTTTTNDEDDNDHNNDSTSTSNNNSNNSKNDKHNKAFDQFVEAMVELGASARNVTLEEFNEFNDTYKKIKDVFRAAPPLVLSWKELYDDNKAFLMKENSKLKEVLIQECCHVVAQQEQQTGETTSEPTNN